MRFLIKIDIPSQGKCAGVGAPDFENELTRLYLAVGAQSAYTRISDKGTRTDAIVVEISDVRELEPTAKMIFGLLNVRPVFMLETARKDDFGF